MGNVVGRSQEGRREINKIMSVSGHALVDAREAREDGKVDGIVSWKWVTGGWVVIVEKVVSTLTEVELEWE